MKLALISLAALATIGCRVHVHRAGEATMPSPEQNVTATPGHSKRAPYRPMTMGTYRLGDGVGVIVSFDIRTDGTLLRTQFWDSGRPPQIGSGRWRSVDGVLHFEAQVGPDSYVADPKRYVYAFWGERCYLIAVTERAAFLAEKIRPSSGRGGGLSSYNEKEPRSSSLGRYLLHDPDWTIEVVGDPVFSDEMEPPH